MSGRIKPAEPLAIGNDAMERAAGVAQRGMDQATAATEQTIGAAAARVEVAQGKVKEGMDRVMRTTEELVAFGQGNFEAVVKSGQIWVSGVQDIGKHVAASAQASFDETMGAFRAMSSVKSLKDAFDLQAGLARSSVEKAMAETSRLTDASVRLAEQTMAPLNARVTLAVEKFAKVV